MAINRGKKGQSRARAKSEPSPPAASIENADAPKNREERVRFIANLMASGAYRRGRTVKELAQSWGMTTWAVSETASEASRHVRGAVDVGELVRTVSETIDELLEIGHACKEAKEHREAIVAFGKAGELCLAILKGRDDDESKPLPEREAFAKLVQMGWRPPITLPGLPEPIEDPEEGATEDV